MSGSIVEASLTESLEASGTGVLTGSRQAEMTENSRSELFSDDGLVATMDGFAVPEHIRPDVDTIRRVDGLRSDAVNEDAKMSTVGWDRPPLGGMGAADPQRAQTMSSSVAPVLHPPPPTAPPPSSAASQPSPLDAPTLNTTLTGLSEGDSIISGLSWNDTRNARHEGTLSRGSLRRASAPEPAGILPPRLNSDVRAVAKAIAADEGLGDGASTQPSILACSGGGLWVGTTAAVIAKGENQRVAR